MFVDALLREMRQEVFPYSEMLANWRFEMQIMVKNKFMRWTYLLIILQHTIYADEV